MNIYLDTNILFTDPFFRSDYSRLLLNSSKEKTVCIVIPSICLNEIYYKLTTKAKNLGNEINSKIVELNKWMNESNPTISFDIPKYEQSIKSFYSEKINEEIFIRLDYKSEYFKENLDKAIKKSQPFFTEKKQEFRDALIWSIIRDHAILHKDYKNYFVTSNYSDFWNNVKTDLHPNLKKENGNIVIIDSINKLFELEPELIDSKKKQEFKEWLEKQGVNVEMVQDAVNKYLWNHIGETIDLLIKKHSIDDIRPEYGMGYIVPVIDKGNFKIEEIIKTTVIQDFAAIQIESSLRFEGKLYFPNPVKGDFSNYEANQFIAHIVLVVSYDKFKLFKPISVNLKNIIIE